MDLSGHSSYQSHFSPSFGRPVISQTIAEPMTTFIGTEAPLRPKLVSDLTVSVPGSFGIRHQASPSYNVTLPPYPNLGTKTARPEGPNKPTFLSAFRALEAQVAYATKLKAFSQNLLAIT